MQNLILEKNSHPVLLDPKLILMAIRDQILWEDLRGTVAGSLQSLPLRGRSCNPAHWWEQMLGSAAHEGYLRYGPMGRSDLHCDF